MNIGPRNISLQEIGINSIGGLISGIIGSIMIILFVLGISKFINIPETFTHNSLTATKTNPLFPFILSFMTLISLLVSTYISAKVLNMTDPEKYKQRREIYNQIGFLSLVVYFCLFPVYIISGMQNYDNIMIIFIVHCILFSFGTSLLLEFLNSYRSVLIGFYGAFIASSISSVIAFWIFFSFSSSQAKLLLLLVVIPVIYTLNTLIK